MFSIVVVQATCGGLIPWKVHELNCIRGLRIHRTWIERNKTSLKRSDVPSELEE